MEISRIFLVAISALLIIAVPSESCIQKLKRAAEFDNFTKTCFAKAGFTKVPSHEEILKPGFDDKCAATCTMGAIDVIDDNGRIDKDALSDFLGENAPEQILLKLNEVATACVDSSGADKVQGTKQGRTADECKAIGKFYTCFVAAADKLC